MDALRRYYLDRLRQRVGELEAACRHLDVAGGDAEPVRRIAHQLKGTGTSFGFPDVSDAAAALDRAVRDGDRALAARRLDDLLAVLRRHGAEAP